MADAPFDLVIRRGTVVDGTGAAPREADVGVAGGRIAAVAASGTLATAGAGEVIDADGLLVTPGFVDIHTHYDGQVTWDSSLAPSSSHGVTTVVMGNCGVGFAPVHAGDHDALIELMEGVEDIPGAALVEGVPFTWETFAEYLDAVERVPHDIDVAAQVPHGAVRLYVMGRRGADREPATAAEIAEMGRIVAEAVEAGAFGFTTSRTLNHRTVRGEPTPTLTAAEDELVGIAEAMGRTGKGVIELISDFPDGPAEFDRLRHMVAASGRPLTFSLMQAGTSDGYRTMLDRIDRAQADGLDIRAQVATRPTGVLFGLQATLSPFDGNDVYRTLALLPWRERLERLRDASVREAILAAVPPGPNPLVEGLYELVDPPDYEQPPERTLGARARAEGRPAAELAYEAMVADDGRRFLWFPFAGYLDGDFEALRELLEHPRTLIGLGDGGAHVGTISDASNVTSLLTHWVRDRTRGPRLDLAWAVHAHTQRNAQAMGLHDRGVVAPGFKADLNVIDLDHLVLHAPEMHYDLPAGGKRLLQPVDGYVATVVAGTIIARDGTPTGATPGRLLRA